VVCVLVAAVVVAWGISTGRFRTGRAPEIDFYGLVVDEAGVPVDGAEVRIHVTVKDPTAEGRTGPGESKEVVLHSDANGRFALNGERGLHIAVGRVGYGDLALLVDLAEHSIYQAKRELVGNQFFNYTPLLGPVYLPDPNRPAVFSLYRKDSKATGKIARGGSDRYPDGRVVRNEPRTPLLPSAGGDVPLTIPERDRRARAIWESLTGKGPPLQLRDEDKAPATGPS
jgi:hypothetical protein